MLLNLTVPRINDYMDTAIVQWVYPTEGEALEIAEGAPLMLVVRTAYARSGEPLEYARDLFRGDRTRVVVWTSELAGDL